MKKICFYVNDLYINNEIFNSENVSNRDNVFYGNILLRNELEKYGFDLATQDINKVNESDLVIYNDMPCSLPRKSQIRKSILILYESELIKPLNWDLTKHSCFSKIFTWNDEVIDEKKYFKINYSQKMSRNIEFNLKQKNKLCALIAGNKLLKHELELYSERINIIRWFEHNHPVDFDLYGMGWDKYLFTGIFRRLNKLGLPAKLFGAEYPSYKGVVKSKNEVLSNYKFTICYENAKDIPGYITEKIFDCFAAGCVPVYWGAPNITKYVPEDAFIDKRNFSSSEELYKFIKSMPDNEYIGYLDAIKCYLNSDKIKPFTVEYFVETIVKEVINKFKVN